MWEMVVLSKSFLDSIWEISRNCVNTGGVLRAMKRVMEQTARVEHAKYELDLHINLKNIKVGPTSIEILAKKICYRLPSRRKEALKEIVVKWRIIESRNELRTEKYKNTKVWRESKTIIETENKLGLYNRLWATEKHKLYKYYKEKIKNKMQFYSNKYRKTKKIPDEIQGIIIRDQAIPEGIIKPPKCYGNSQITDAEKEVLMLSPKYAVFDKVDSLDCRAEVEKAMAKYRWSYTTNESERNETSYLKGQTFDFRNMRATDLPFNKRVFLPKAIKQEVEIEIQILKQRLQMVTTEYITNDNRNNMLSNLTRKQKSGLKSLKKRKKNQEIVIFQTDKTNSFSTDTIDNYRQACQIHIENDRIINNTEKGKLEAVMNAHGVMWTRFLNAGKNNNQEERIRKNMLNENCEVSPLYTLRKDHKFYEDEVVGPPTRPICGAESCYNGKMSYLLSTILTPITEESKTSCRSTEEMIAAINLVNTNGIEEDVIVGSADVKALYPNLNIPDTVKIVGEMFIESKMEIKGVDHKELSLYLSLNRSREQLEIIGIENCCPKRRSNRGLKPTITASGIKTKKSERYGPWNFPVEKPTKQQIKLMLMEAIKVGLEVVLNNHIYTYDGVNRKQNSGGAIGLQLTGVIANIFMTWWDRQLVRRINGLGIECKMYERYVDDINIVTKGQIHGKRYKNGEIEVSEERKKDDDSKENDEVMMEFIKSVGDEIHPSIKLEVDYPSRYEDERLPILDIKVWITRRKSDEKRVIMYEYYEKEISSKWVLHAQAALTLSTKRIILTQQVLRIFLNCSKDLPWQEIIKHVNKMMIKVQLSGYNQKFRHEIVDSAMKAYNRINKDDLNGVKPMYRIKGYQKERRHKEKEKKKKEWYQNGGYKSVIFIKATPESKLRKQYEAEIKKTTLKIKVVEQSGTPLKRILQTSNPFRKDTCGDDTCLVCKSSGKSNCRRVDVKYNVTCEKEDCRGIYHGESSKNAYSRGKEHETDYRNHLEKSHMWKHCVTEHNSEEQTFNMHIDRNFRKDPLLRQITEAIAIQDTDEELRMNSRSEWNQRSIPRITINS